MSLALQCWCSPSPSRNITLISVKYLPQQERGKHLNLETKYGILWHLSFLLNFNILYPLIIGFLIVLIFSINIFLSARCKLIRLDFICSWRQDFTTQCSKIFTINIHLYYLCTRNYKGEMSQEYGPSSSFRTL